MTDDTMAQAVKAAAEALAPTGRMRSMAEAHYCAEAAVTAAAPILLAPVEAKVEYERGGWDYYDAEVMRNATLTAERDEARAEVERLRVWRDDGWTAERAARRERDEAVAAERRRIFAVIRADEGWHKDDWGVPCLYDDALDRIEARTAGETSTTRDANPGDTQDARRSAEMECEMGLCDHGPGQRHTTPAPPDPRPTRRR